MILHGFSDVAHILSEFDAPEGALDGCKVLFAMYSYGDYEGSAFVLYVKNEQLFEVHGSHCSCYGLEQQWSPEPTFKAALQKQEHYMCGEDDAKLVKDFIDSLPDDGHES
jgi:hypothetical protein